MHSGEVWLLSVQPDSTTEILKLMKHGGISIFPDG